MVHLRRHLLRFVYSAIAVWEISRKLGCIVDPWYRSKWFFGLLKECKWRDRKISELKSRDESMKLSDCGVQELKKVLRHSCRNRLSTIFSTPSRHQLMHLVQRLSLTAWAIIHGRIDSLLHAIYLPLLWMQLLIFHKFDIILSLFSTLFITTRRLIGLVEKCTASVDISSRHY